MEFFLDLIFLVVGFVMLVKGADWFVEGASGIASKLGVSQLVIGLTIVAMGTSAPEAAVSIAAALKGSADITIGNVVGSNVMNVLLILGLSATIALLPVERSTVNIEIPFVIVITLLLLVLGLDGTVSRSDGMILAVIFVGFLLYLFYCAKKKPEEKTEEPGEAKKPRPMWLTLVMTVLGLGLIVLGSDLAVDGATGIARVFGLSERFIGLTIVALGTSLPELFTSVVAAKKGNADIAIGNIVGSNIFNILMVVGFSSLIIPVPFASSFRLDILVAAFACVLLWLGCVRDKVLGRRAGLAMLACYALYLAQIMFDIV